MTSSASSRGQISDATPDLQEGLAVPFESRIPAHRASEHVRLCIRDEAHDASFGRRHRTRTRRASARSRAGHGAAIARSRLSTFRPLRSVLAG